MNILEKSTILALFILLSGCAQHSGYYSGRSNIGVVGIGIDSYTSLPSYPVYYGRDNYRRQYKRHKYFAYKPYYKGHGYFDGGHDERHEYTERYSKRKHKRYDRDYGRDIRRERYRH